MRHPHEKLLEELYAKFGQGDLPGVLAMCDDEIIFTVPGKARISGQYTKTTFPDLIGQVMAISKGSFREALVEVVANDEHGVALLDHSLEIDSQQRSYRTDHIWAFRGSKPIAWQERPGDQEMFDRIWS